MTRREAIAGRLMSAGLAFLSRVAPPLAGRLVTWLWFTPFPFARGRAPRLPGGAAAVEFGDGDRIVFGFGAGPRVALLVHGWAGSSRQYRRLAARLGSAGYRVVVIDLPAHGRESGSQTNVFEIAEAIEVVARELGSINLLVAHSLGAMSAAVAIRRSVEADRVVFVAPGLEPRQVLDTFAAALDLRPNVKAALVREMENRFGGDVWETMTDALLGLEPSGALLIVHDADDEMVPISDAELLSRTLGADLLVTEGQGHNGVLRSGLVLDRITEFAQAHPTWG